MRAHSLSLPRSVSVYFCLTIDCEAEVSDGDWCLCVSFTYTLFLECTSYSQHESRLLSEIECLNPLSVNVFRRRFNCSWRKVSHFAMHYLQCFQRRRIFRNYASELAFKFVPIFRFFDALFKPLYTQISVAQINRSRINTTRRRQS